MQNNDLTVRRKNYVAGKEIKASAHYAYVVNGITLDGTKFKTGAYLEEGTCLGKNTDGKYEAWKEIEGVTETSEEVGSLTNPVILDESILFTLDNKGKNVDLTAGQVIVHGAVYESMLVACDDTFKTAVGAAVRFV